MDTRVDPKISPVRDGAAGSECSIHTVQPLGGETSVTDIDDFILLNNNAGLVKLNN